MARPYSMAGFFMVLGWRWWPGAILAILTSPMAVLGVNPALWRRSRLRPVLIGLLLLGVAAFRLRPDHDRGFFEWRFLTHAARIWLIPLLVVLLHLGSRRLPLAGPRNRDR
jgi:hypothetical protein